jgi:hypothetical protein
MGARNPAANAQTQPASFHVVAVARISPEKRIKNSRQNFRRNTLTGI